MKTALLVSLILLSFSFFRCQRLNTGLFDANLCGEINPIKPNPTLPVPRDYSGNELLDSGCVFTYQRLIAIAPATTQDEKQIRVVLDQVNFDYNNIDPEGTTIRFMDADLNIYDYWIERWNPLGESILWVQIPDAGTTEVNMFYGETAFTPGSNPATTFDYSTDKPIYFNLRSATVNAGVASYTDENIVQPAGLAAQTLAENQTVIFNSTTAGLVNVRGAINGRQININGHQAIAPISLSGTSFGYHNSRGSDNWEVFNPGTATANINIESYNGAGAPAGADFNGTLTPGQRTTINYNVNSTGLLTSTQPIIVSYRAGTTDANVLPPAANEYTGVHYGTLSVGILTDGTNGEIFFSNGSSQTFSGNRGEVIEVAGGATQGAGNSYVVKADQPIVASSQADSDGNETVTGMPLSELNRDYIIPTDAQYISISSPYSNELQLFDDSGALITTVAGSTNSDTPLKFYFGTTANVISFTAGARITGTQPFYVYYEFDTQDETLAFGPKQGRLIDFPEPTTTVGAEESAL